MYQTSLEQYLRLFGKSIESAESTNSVVKRVTSIVEKNTYISWRYVNRGLYEEDKVPFLMNILLKTLVREDLLTESDVGLLIRGGAGVDRKQHENPFAWMSDESYFNVVELARKIPAFSGLMESLKRSEQPWKIGMKKQNLKSTQCQTSKLLLKELLAHSKSAY